MDKKTHSDWYADVTDRIIASLEAGPGEWAKPWKSLSVNGMPRNGSSNRAYNGINVWLLALSGFSDARWYTFNQARNLSASVRKGEKGTKIVYWQFIAKKDANGDDTDRKIPFLRVFTVFNASQIDGLASGEAPPAVDASVGYERAARCIATLGASVAHGGDRAYYSPTDDQIRLPSPGQFDSLAHYWSTSLHEHAHWTGHERRLARDLRNRFGSDAYAMEELIAEISAAFTCAALGIEGELAHPEYINSWLKVLRGDKRAVFSAAAAAQKAASLILNGGAVEAEAEAEAEATDEVPLAQAA
jgi:antirestriction protein ArdC